MDTGREIVKETWRHPDLVPGSYYKFRVRTHTESLGLSAPSGESDSMFLGEPPEDELFGLPGGNYPKSQNNLALHHRQQSYMGIGFGGARSGRDDDHGLLYCASFFDFDLCIDHWQIL